MNLRLPVVVSIVAVAAGVAAVRALRPPEPTARPFAVATSAANTFGVAHRFERLREAGRPEARVVVYVAGAVNRAGVYALPSSARAVDALRSAGGATASADLVRVNLATPLADGEEVIVPEKGADDVGAISDSAPPPQHKRKRRRGKRRHHRLAAPAESMSDAAAGPTPEAVAADEPSASVDLNTADANELETLPGIGSALAERIVTFRELNGPFAAADDLLDVGGMTQKRLDSIEPFLTTL